MAIGIENFNVQDATVRVTNWRNLRRVDWLLLAVVLALAIIGWLTLYSAGRSTEVQYVHRQIGGFVLGALIATFIVAADYRFLVSLAPVMYAAAVAVLFLVVQVGEARQGSARWLGFLGVEVQPSEFTKVIMIYFLTWYLTTLGDRIRKLHWFLLAFVLTGIPMLLILKQPNLGTAASLAPLVFVMLFVAGCRYWHLAMIVLAGFSVVPMVWLQIRDFDPSFKVIDADADANHGNRDGIASYEEFGYRFSARYVPQELRDQLTEDDILQVRQRGQARVILQAFHEDGHRRIEAIFDSTTPWTERAAELREEGYEQIAVVYRPPNPDDGPATETRKPAGWALSQLDTNGDGAISEAEFMALDTNGDGMVTREDKGRLELYHHQKERIYTFLNPEHDIRNTGWQTYQSKITVGSGGFSGKGFMNGTQTRLNYLPEHHTDFIFSLLAEERGFVGVVIVIGAYLILLLRGLSHARQCPEMMGTLLATGVVTVLAFHIFVNIAITVGMLPVTGIPLPFLSYGRSFYLTTMICVGILLNVPMRRRVFVNQ